MKCPKCGYIGFEQTDRCRNCGYDFVLAASPVPEPDLPLRRTEAAPLGDFDLGDAGPPAAGEARGARRRYDPDLDPRVTPPGRTPGIDLPLFEDAAAAEAPLVPAAAATPPLAVRRSTPPAVRARPRATPRVVMPAPETRLPLADGPFAPPMRVDPQDAADASLPSPGSRILAGVLDWSLFLGVDAVVLYFTLKICRLDVAEALLLPLPPLVAFLVLLNGGYIALLTAAGGQTLGKMACGLKVVGPDDGAVPPGRAIARTVLLLLATLAAGLGLLPILLTSSRRGVHDQLAGTRVVRCGASAE
jgi:uncharacterized RDD family membrane protein YckC